MTLILTEATSLGIAMAADSSVTFGNGRSFLGVQKLLPIRSLNAGVSAWGAGAIGDIETDMWLQRLIESTKGQNISLWNFAELLAEKLNEAVGGTLDFHSGVHLAGYDLAEDGNRYPAIYHIHNGHYEFVGSVLIEHEPIREFIAHKDYPPQSKENDGYMLRNGDFLVFSRLWTVLNYGLASLYRETGFTHPYPDNLETRGEYLRNWIKFISGIYRLSNAFPQEMDLPIMGGGASIGGPVTVLTIDNTGIRSYYSI